MRDQATVLSPARQRSTAPDPQIASSEYIKPGDIARFIRSYLSVIAGCTLVGLVLGGLYAHGSDRIYVARTQIMIVPKQLPLLRDQPGEVVFSLDNAAVESQIALLRSESTSAEVVRRLNLANDPEFTTPKPGMLQRLLSAIGYGSTQAMTDYERERMTLEALAQGLDVRRVGLSYAIDISFASRDTQKAATIANEFADAYISQQVETRIESARVGNRWVEGRIEELRTQLNDSVFKLQQIRASHDYRLPEDPKDARSRQNTVEELEATAQTYKKLYESFLQSFAETVYRQQVPSPDARVITAATRPLGPTYPRTQPIIAVSGLIGAIAGFAIALVRDNRRRRLSA